MDHSAHLRTYRVLEINYLEQSYDYTNRSFWNKLLSPIGRSCGPSFEETRLSFTQECVVLSFVEKDPMVLEKKIFFNGVSVYSLFCFHVHLKKSMILALHLSKLLLHIRMLCAKFRWKWPSVWSKKWPKLRFDGHSKVIMKNSTSLKWDKNNYLTKPVEPAESSFGTSLYLSYYWT